MSISGATVTSVASGTDATSYSTASVTPTANRLLIAAVSSSRGGATPSVPSCTGFGATWVQIPSATVTLVVGGATFRLTLFSTLSGGSPSTTVFTADWGAETQAGASISVSEFSLAQNSFVQVVPNTITASASLSISLSAFGAGNGGFAAFTSTANNVVTPDTGWTELHDLGHNTPAERIETQWRADSDTTASASQGAAADWLGIAIEIRAQGWGQLLGGRRNRLIYPGG